MSKEQKEENQGNEQQKTLAEMLQEAKLDDIFVANKELKAEYDRKVRKGIETYKASNPIKKEEEKEEKKDGDKDAEKGEKSGIDSMPEWAKQMQIQQQKMMDAFNSSQKQKTVAAMVNENKKFNDVPDILKKGYIKRLTNAEDADEELNEIEEEIEAISKLTKKEDRGLPVGGGTSKNKKPTKEDMKKVFGKN